MTNPRPLKEDDRRIADPGFEDRDEHPIGSTVGTGAGVTVGAVAGMGLGGPVGAVVGGVIGGVIGGATGQAAAAIVNPNGDSVDGDVIPDPGTATKHHNPANEVRFETERTDEV